MEFLAPISILVVILLFISRRGPSWKPAVNLDDDDRRVLNSKIPFYRTLTTAEKKQFEFKVGEFLANTKITGIKTDVQNSDRLLVAASAIIPIFSFPEWRYSSLKEVLLYPSSFDENFKIEGENRNILGMVGSGYMKGKMILSKPSLHLVFSNETDKKKCSYP